MNSPHNVNAAQWNQAVGYARQSCARIFRDGGSPGDAMAAFGLNRRSASRPDWARAVEHIALSLCAPGR